MSKSSKSSFSASNFHSYFYTADKSLSWGVWSCQTFGNLHRLPLLRGETTLLEIVVRLVEHSWHCCRHIAGIGTSFKLNLLGSVVEVRSFLAFTVRFIWIIEKQRKVREDIAWFDLILTQKKWSVYYNALQFNALCLYNASYTWLKKRGMEKVKNSKWGVLYKINKEGSNDKRLSAWDIWASFFFQKWIFLQLQFQRTFRPANGGIFISCSTFTISFIFSSNRNFN